MTSNMLWKHRFRHLGSRMLRQKDVGEKDVKTELRRILTWPQLTLLGVGSTIGVGIYILLGEMVKNCAGPSVIFSFMAALFVTLMNALVFAEFATFIPQTGGAYIYIYKVFGEFLAFLMGWTVLFVYLLSSSVSARAWSGMLDSFFNNTIQEKTIEVFGKIQFGLPFAESLDILAFLFQIVITVIVSCNVLCSSIVNTLLGILTSSVLAFVFISGFIYGDVKNFTNVEHGGFFPFGITGVIKGASLAIYATTGFETISMSAEEAKNPAKAVPRALACELFIVGLLYIGASVGMLYLIPYWLIDLRAPLPSAFEYSNFQWGKVVVTIGPIFGITNLQMLGLYAFSRLTYRMAKDGLIFSWFLKVNKRTGVPLNSIVTFGALISLFSTLFDLSYLVQVSVVMMLLNYIIVGSALIKHRITESSRSQTEQTVGRAVTKEESAKRETDFYEHEIVVSEYETCDSTESLEANTLTTDGYISTDNSALLELPGNNHSEERHLSNCHKSVSGSTETSQGQTIVQQDGIMTNDSLQEQFAVHHFEKDRNAHRPINGTGTETLDISERSNIVYDPHLSDEDDSILFQKPSAKAVDLTFGQQLIGLNKSESNIDRTKPNNNAGIASNSRQEQLALYFSPFVPGVLSENKFLVAHWVCCFMLAVQVNYGWQDLAHYRPIALLACTLLVFWLLFSCVVLWSMTHCQSATGFQTPLMPLVPTLSLLLSMILLLLVADVRNLVEICILQLSGAVAYIIMVLMNYTGPQSAEEEAQRKLLVGGSENDADDEVESEDEL